MNYEQALEFIHGTYRFGSKLGLENIEFLLELMNNPHEHMKVIHVAGTNGKGSTCAFISAVLVEQGYRVGLYTSPYLEEFTERIRINGVDIPKEQLAEMTDYVRDKVEQMIVIGKNHPTEFEIVTAIGFEYFKRQEIDFLVLEVGLGGRGDSTNVIKNPLVSVITPIDYDHMDYLGDTLAKISYEKAGIIKENSLVVSYPQQEEAMDVIKRVSQEKNAKLRIVSMEDVEIIGQDIHSQSFNVRVLNTDFQNLSISMVGEHQIQNATLALTALIMLAAEHDIRLSREAIYQGLRKANWPGRLEVMQHSPTVLIDGAHNVHGLRALAKVVDQFFQGKRIILGFGLLADKDVVAMLDIIVPKIDELVLTEPFNPRALKVEKLASLIGKYNKPYYSEKDIDKAVSKALEMAREDDVVVFCGSLYMIGQVRSIMKNNNN